MSRQGVAMTILERGINAIGASGVELFLHKGIELVAVALAPVSDALLAD